MILRRLSQSLKEQNWAAIVIEFVLLVAGVFLGIQVANWNEERRDRLTEVEYLDRLRQEIASMLPQAQTTKASLAEQLGQIKELRTFLASGEGRDVLDVRHCIAAGRSHIYAATIYYPPTIKELIATGRILLIRNAGVRTAIMSFEQSYADLSQLRTDIQIDRRVLARHYPALINSGLSTEWSGARCDFEAMRNDQAFLNDFTDNMRRYAAYSAALGEQQAQSLEALQKALASDPSMRAREASADSAQAGSNATQGAN